MKIIKFVLMLFAIACIGPVMAGLSIEEYCQVLQEQKAAIQRGDWPMAASYSAIASWGDNVTGFIPINAVNSALLLVLCDWNYEGIENRAENCQVLQGCVNVCEQQIAKGCGARLAEFLKKMKAGELDGIKFTANDMLSSVGLVEYLLEEPRSATDANYAKRMAHLNALMRQIDASTDVYRKEGEWYATQAKFAASMKYQQKHHKTFDPNNRPPRDSASREDWDSCKRIYDIFARDSVSSSTVTPTTSYSSATKPRKSAFTDEEREAAKAVISRTSPMSSSSSSTERAAAQASRTVATDFQPEAKRYFDLIDQAFEGIMSSSATEVRLAPGDDLAAAIANATGRTTIHLPAGRYVISGDNESCNISDKIRIFGEGPGKTVIAGNITVKSGEDTSLVLKDLTLIGPTESENGELKVGNSMVAFDNVELKCVIKVEMYGIVSGRRLRQSLRDSILSRNSFSCASHSVFKDSSFAVGGFDVGIGGCVAFGNCVFTGKKHPDEKNPWACFTVYGDREDGCVPFYLSHSIVKDFDLVFQSVTSEIDPRKNGIYLNDVLLKSCTAIVDTGTCKVYGLRMMDMDVDDSSIDKASEPLYIPSSW